MAAQYDNIPVPGFVNPTGTYTDPEILYSTAGFTQKGVTIAAGQGVLREGTVLAQKTSDKKYYAYNDGGTGGLQTARGILRRACDTGTTPTAGDQLGNLVIAGILKNDLLHGIDNAALADLGGVVDLVRNTMKF